MFISKMEINKKRQRTNDNNKEEEKGLFPDYLVHINFGGAKRTIAYSTLAKYPSTLLGCLFLNYNTNKHKLRDKKGRFYFDRPPRHVDLILDWYRTDGFSIQCRANALSPEEKHELEYWGIQIQNERKIESYQRWGNGLIEAYEISIFNKARRFVALLKKRFPTIDFSRQYAKNYKLEIPVCVPKGRQPSLVCSTNTNVHNTPENIKDYIDPLSLCSQIKVPEDGDNEQLDFYFPSNDEFGKWATFVFEISGLRLEYGAREGRELYSTLFTARADFTKLHSHISKTILCNNANHPIIKVYF